MTINNATINNATQSTPVSSQPENINFFQSAPLHVLARIFEYAGTAALAVARDIPSIREITNTFTPVELKKIGAPEDMNTPPEAENIELISSVALNDEGTLTEFSQKVLASSPYTTALELEILALNGSPNVKSLVAENPNTPVESFRVLARDESANVRRSVAENPNTPVEGLMRLAGDENEWVKSLVAQHPDASVELLTTLAGDETDMVRDSVAKNPKMQHALSVLHIQASAPLPRIRNT